MNCSMWDHGYCPECDLYTRKLCKGYPVKPKDDKAATFQVLNFGKSTQGNVMPTPEKMLKIKLKLVDVDRNITRICEIDEAKTWDWGNPEIMRVIGDWQVTSFDMLLFILTEKEEKGEQEVSLFEAPRFMMLAGG